MSTVREIFGSNVRHHRKSMNWTQDGLASLMTDRGFKWRQTTLTKVEAGERPVAVDEATTLAALFGTTVDALLKGTRDGSSIEIALAESEVRVQRERVAAAVASRDAAVQHLADLQRAKNT